MSREKSSLLEIICHTVEWQVDVNIPKRTHCSDESFALS